MYYTSEDTYELISKEVNDPIREWKNCTVSWMNFPIYESEKWFFASMGLLAEWVKHALPFPTLCPEERQRRRMARKNDHHYFRRTCDKTWESIISTYHSSLPWPVYSVKAWRSDAWDALQYAQEIQRDKSFFSQYKELHNKVPKIAMMNDNGVASENCEYCQNVAYSKDCYLTTVSWKLRDCYYSSNMATGEYLIDSFFTMDSKVCYECTESYDLHTCFYIQKSYSSQRCFFWYDLRWCADCAFCIGLTNKKYCIFNTEYSKEEYQEKIQKIRLDFQHHPEKYLQKRQDFQQGKKMWWIHNVQVEESVWNNLVNTKSTLLCFNLKNAKKCKYWRFWDTWIDGVDLTVWGELERCYEGIVPDNSVHCTSTIFCWKCIRVRYSEMCHWCTDCFGCVWLKNKQYCIFNKQYTKEEYEKKVAKLIALMKEHKERWEFFPISLSPYPYNHTIAQDYFPLSEESVEAYWSTWWVFDKQQNSNETLQVKLSLSDAEILKSIFTCKVSWRKFKIMPKELEFYRKHSLPLPTLHPYERYKKRLAVMSAKELEQKNNELQLR